MTPLFRKFHRKVGIGAMHYLVNLGCCCQQNRTTTISCDPEDIHMMAGALNEIRPTDLTDALFEYGLLTQDPEHKRAGTACVKFFADMNRGIVSKFGNSNAVKPGPPKSSAPESSNSSSSPFESKEETDIPF